MMAKTISSMLLVIYMALCFAPRLSLSERNDRNYWEFTGPDDFPYYPQEFNDNSLEIVYELMRENEIQEGDYYVDDFVVGGVNLAEYEMLHPPFLLYEDFDISSHVVDGPTQMNWKELLKIRNGLERPSLSWYVDKVARKRWFAKEEVYPQPEVYYVQYKDELSRTGRKEDELKTILDNLPTTHGFCAKPTHMSMTMGNWLVDIEPGNGSDEAKFTKHAERLTSNDYEGNSYDPNECADSLAEGLQREAVSIESWALKNVQPGIVVEELFSSYEDRNLPPHEFCMFVIWGKVYVGQWNMVGEIFDDWGENRYLSGFFYRNGGATPGCLTDRLPDWVPWDELVKIAESLSKNKDMFRVDMFVGVPRYSDEGAELQIVVSESEIHPTTMFCNPLIADEMARLWLAGYRIGNYKTIPNDEVPLDYINKQTMEAAVEDTNTTTNANANTITRLSEISIEEGCIP